MKKLILLCILPLFISCSNDDYDGYSIDIVPVESVDIPNEFQLGETYPITVFYYNPSTCHFFREFYYSNENNERTVAPVTYVYERADCVMLEDDLVEATFNFKATSNGSYIFKFWQGDDLDGNPMFLSIEVPVVD